MKFPCHKMLLVFALASGERALACASCGSGGDDPLILYPWERWKIYTGFSHTNDFIPIDINGNPGGEFGPETKDTTLVSLGHSFSNRSFATISAPYILNKRGPAEERGWGDPMLTVRYTIIQQDMTNDYTPQVQLLGAVRSGRATSVYDYKNPAQLDVMGSGAAEGRAGIDVWHGMFDWKAGVAQTVTAPLESRKTDFGDVKNGTSFRSTMTLGYGWGDRGKILTGVNREQTTKKLIDSRFQANSEKLNHSVFVTADAKVDRQSLLRLTVARAAAFGLNQNTSQNQSVTFAVMRSF